jgi:DNA-binding response OmpR family regulator
MKHKKLLIIDDERRFADMLAKRLNLRGFKCDACYRGQEALEILEQKKFHLILLDLHLPDIYGTEVLTRIRQNDESTPVIVVTGHGTEKDRLECIQQGAYAFMHKPVSLNELITILGKIGEIPA